MYFRGIVIHGVMDKAEWSRFLGKAAEAMGMSPVGKPASWDYPLHGAGGTGSTLVQPITESFLALDTWPDHRGAYLFICSCKPFSPDCLYPLFEEFGLEEGHSIGAPAMLEISR